MVLSATILSPSSETTVFSFDAEITITLCDENEGFLEAAPNTSIGAVTSLVKKPSNTRIPSNDDCAQAQVDNTKLMTSRITNRFILFMIFLHYTIKLSN